MAEATEGHSDWKETIRNEVNAALVTGKFCGCGDKVKRYAAASAGDVTLLTGEIRPRTEGENRFSGLLEEFIRSGRNWG